MKAVCTGEYVTQQDLEEAEEQIKRRWKTLVVLLVLAVRAKPQAPEAAEPTVAEKPAKAVPIAKVLLIDADPASSGELAAVLDDAGFEVVTTSDPEEGLRRTEEASLIILDADLSSCEEVCSHIREQSDAPIILLGSDPSEKAWDRAVAMGADAYLRRTVSRPELVARMRALLRRYRKGMPAKGEDNV